MGTEIFGTYEPTPIVTKAPVSENDWYRDAINKECERQIRLVLPTMILNCDTIDGRVVKDPFRAVDALKAAHNADHERLRKKLVRSKVHSAIHAIMLVAVPTFILFAFMEAPPETLPLIMLMTMALWIASFVAFPVSVKETYADLSPQKSFARIRQEKKWGNTAAVDAIAVGRKGLAFVKDAIPVYVRYEELEAVWADTSAHSVHFRYSRASETAIITLDMAKSVSLLQKEATEEESIVVEIASRAADVKNPTSGRTA